MKKFRLLLLDADVVILLFRLAIWDKVIERCDVHLAGAVLGEAHFYVDDEGERQDFDLAPYVAAGKVTRFDMLPSQLTAFLARCSPRFLEKLDAGETESLAYLLSKTDREFAICSADKIVYRILGSLGLAHRGISLEEVLRGLGLRRSLPRQFTKAYREEWEKKGFQEGFWGAAPTNVKS